jgi:hypothetical protein
MGNLPVADTATEVEITNKQRRSLIAVGIRLSFAATVFGSTAAAAEICADPDELSSVDRSFRKYVEYTESSKTPGEACSGCESFRPPSQGECGACRAVAGSINANGHCTGWSARVEKR